MKRHRDWSSAGFEMLPAARATGPFARPPFMQLIANSSTEVFESDLGLAVLDVDSGRVEFGGESDLTDYHTPLGTEIDGLFSGVVEELGDGWAFDLDSMPPEVAEPVAKGLEQAGLDVTIEPHTVAAVLALPGSYEEYLAAIGKKQRHEVRRKRRRYEELVGEVRYESYDAAGFALDEFVRLHRLSDGAKGRFMNAEHEEFFRCLLAMDGWRVDILRIEDSDRAAACLFVFVDESGMFLYNSAYDPLLAEATPGVAILGSAIERAIDEQLPRFDFLKGDEPYKFRLGAQERELFRVTAQS